MQKEDKLPNSGTKSWTLDIQCFLKDVGSTNNGRRLQLPQHIWNTQPLYKPTQTFRNYPQGTQYN